MNKKTWKRLIAMLMICVLAFSSPLIADASENEKVVESKTVKGIVGQTYTEAELRLMSAIIFCEAGAESYKGKVAVGIVVMNRVRSNQFPNTIQEVIYQKGQFSPVSNGMLKKTLALYDKGGFTQKNHLDSIRAAKRVLQGSTTITVNGKEFDMQSFLFFSVYLKNKRLQIGHHMFR